MTRIAAVSLSAIVLMGVPARGDSPALLVSFDELQKRLDDPNLRLLDARPRADYEKGHIPGAVWVDAKAAQALAARPRGLTDRGAWQAWVAPLGIGPKTEVLIYDGNRQLDPARLWGLLRYLGVEKVGLLDGNFPLWQKENRPVATDVASIEPQPFKVTLRSGRYATRGDVLAAIKQGKARVIDARSEAEYIGENKSAKRGGHIPAACRLEWSDLVDKDGRFLDEKALRAKLDTLGVKPGEPVITHCQGGGRASVDAFVLERLGFPTRNYYVGWSDWGNADDTPVATGNEPGVRP
jgi:thiosulfate/3-mercaptopyruvate sulfurtransferase